MTVPPDASSLNGRTLFLRPADGKRVKFILHRYFPHPSFPHHAAARHAVHACTDGNTRRQTVQNHLCGLMERTGIPFAVPIQLQGIGAAAVKEPMHGAFSVPVCISVPASSYKWEATSPSGAHHTSSVSGGRGSSPTYCCTGQWGITAPPRTYTGRKERGHFTHTSFPVSSIRLSVW